MSYLLFKFEIEFHQMEQPTSEMFVCIVGMQSKWKYCKISTNK